MSSLNFLEGEIMTTTIQKIIENYILEEIFCEFPTDLNQGAFYLFLHGDMINQTDAVCDTAYGTEWGFEVCQAYELDNVRAIRGLMQSMFSDLAKLIDNVEKEKEYGHIILNKDELDPLVYQEYKNMPNSTIYREDTADEYIKFITVSLSSVGGAK